MAAVHNLCSAHDLEKGASDLGYEGMIKYPIKELKTNHGGIVIAGERLRPARALTVEESGATTIEPFSCFKLE